MIVMTKFWVLLFCVVFFFLSGCSSMELLMDKFSLKNNLEYSDDEGSSDFIQEGASSKEMISTPDQVHEVEDEKAVLEGAVLNEIQMVNGKEVIQNASNLFALVNKNYGLPAEYFPDDLVRPNVSFSFGDQDIEKSKLRKEAAAALERMFTNAEQSGIILYAVSGYRSYTRQETLFSAEVEKIGEEMAVEAVATPGNSEHQTGLAMDISSRSVGLSLSEQFGETAEGKWLKKNAHKFGFILRYPKGKEQLTGFMYEPWHYRYVGQEVASQIYQNGWTLEEYFELAPKMKDSV
jgi:zinc D-Ala-D-Ala carboxypeptidase